MTDVRWQRLLEEHRQNVARLELERPAPPPAWCLPVGFVLPWLLLAVALTRSTAALPIELLFVPLIVVGGFGCLFIPRLQTVTVGVVLGLLTAALAAQAIWA